jgi:hypothetical protein
MYGYLERRGVLEQGLAVFEVQRRFGEGCWYVNQNGNPAIDTSVLDEFRMLTEGEVVWERDNRLWRWREPYDPPDTRIG